MSTLPTFCKCGKPVIPGMSCCKACYAAIVKEAWERSWKGIR